MVGGTGAMEMDAEQPKLHSYQYRLKSLFILTFLVAVASSLVAVKMRHDEEERKRLETPISKSEWPESVLSIL
jgi:hypothetical protein